MTKQPFKTISKAALAATFAAAAIVPMASVPASAATSSQVDHVVINQGGQMLTVDANLYNEAINEGFIDTSKISYVKSGTDFYAIGDFNEAVNETSSTAAALQMLNEANAQKTVTAVEGKFDSNGNLIPSATTPAKDLKVESVTAINSTELQVKYTQPVDGFTATDLDNYVITINDQKYGEDYTSAYDDEDGIIANNVNKIDFSEDMKTVTFKLNAGKELDNGDKYSIDVKDSVLSADGTKGVVRYGDTQKVFQDYNAPKLLNASLNAANKLVLTFDEPVKAVEDDFKVTVDGQPVDVTASTNVLDYSVVSDTALSGDKIKVGTHNVVVYNARDLVENNGNGGNKTAIAKQSYTVKEGVAPYVTDVKPLDFNSFRVYFSEPVTDAKVVVKKGTAEFYNQVDSTEEKTYVDVHLPLSTSLKNGAAQGALTHLYEEGDNSVNVSLTVSDFKDEDQLFGEKYTSTLNLKRDANTPKAVGQAKNSISGNSLMIALNRTGITVADYSKITVKDKDGVTRTLLTEEAGASVTSSTLSLVLDNGEGAAITNTELEKMAPFTVNFAAGALEIDTDQVDVASIDYIAGEFTNTLKNTSFSTNVNKSGETGYKAVEAVANEGVSIANSVEKGSLVNTITVNYKEKMGPSAGNLSNYTLDGDSFPAGSTITMDGSNKKVTITIPKETFTKDVQHKLVISDNVLTEKGEHVVGNIATKEVFMSQLLEIKDNVAPTLQSATFVLSTEEDKTTDTIELTFSENVNGTSISNENFVVIAHDGTELKATVADIEETGKKATLKLADDKSVNISQAVKVKVVPKSETESKVDQVITDNNGNLLMSGTVVTAKGTKVVTIPAP
ncbi:Ig-like domain-containing protein [Sporosarcina trichiuri]|uniref:Ig-like domain-containing protein n=1 Tax=Sporosarcina trichiuri TaxID=3056445 RepID=UPI0025B2FA98|nr:Ig-like domain-containing protein [Sporosarcina sp. 0.2-SM1T-5]WJY26450.1 Ig-like domain-containing protein [Sporosarcina sp. 0.2-SM1T-5]